MSGIISYNTMKRTSWFAKRKRTIKKTALWTGVFIVSFVVAFTIINWNAVKFNVEYKLEGSSKGETVFEREYIEQLQSGEERYYEGEDRLIIPKINVEAPIVYADTFEERAIQEYLKRGLIHYVGTAKPGEVGNTVIVGHSSTYQWDDNSYGRVFALLNELEAGDFVFVIADHQKWKYTVTEKFIVNPKQVEVLSQEGFEKPTVTLMSCWPIGTYWKRLIVRGELERF